MRSAIGIARDAAKEQRMAIRRLALKHWLYKHGVKFPEFIRYSESGLRKLVRDKISS